MDVVNRNGKFWCVPCYLTEMATLQGYAVCPYCKNSVEL